MMKSKVLLVGPLGAGKSTLARQLEVAGWDKISAAEVLRSAATGLHVPFSSREQMQDFGQRLLRLEGDDYLASLLAAKARGKPRVVFEGVRPLGVALGLKRRFPDLFVIYVDAPISVRKERVLARDKISGDKFDKYDSKFIEAQVTDLRDIADCSIENTDDIGSANAKLASVLDETCT